MRYWTVVAASWPISLRWGWKRSQNRVWDNVQYRAGIAGRLWSLVRQMTRTTSVSLACYGILRTSTWQMSENIIRILKQTAGSVSTPPRRAVSKNHSVPIVLMAAILAAPRKRNPGRSRKGPRRSCAAAQNRPWYMLVA